MNLEYLYSVAYSFLSNNQWVAVGIVVVLALLLWKKPGAFFKLIFAAIALVVLLYIGSLLGDIGGTGVSNKNTMIHETESKMSD